MLIKKTIKVDNDDIFEVYLFKFVFSGLLNPLDAPHQMRADDTRSAYREGVIVNKEVRDGHKGSFANVGLSKDCLVNKSLVEGVRCTVKIDNYQGILYKTYFKKFLSTSHLISL